MKSNFFVIEIKIDQDSDAARGAGTPLTKPAVTNQHAHRVAFDTISMCSAKTATLMDFRHMLPLPLF